MQTKYVCLFVLMFGLFSILFWFYLKQLVNVQFPIQYMIHYSCSAHKPLNCDVTFNLNETCLMYCFVMVGQGEMIFDHHMYCVALSLDNAMVVLTLRAAGSTPALTARPDSLVHHLALHLWGSEVDGHNRWKVNIMRIYCVYSISFNICNCQLEIVPPCSLLFWASSLFWYVMLPFNTEYSGYCLILEMVIYCLSCKVTKKKTSSSWTFHLLEQETGCLGALLFVVQCDAIITPVPSAHPVHVQSPTLGVVLIDLRAAHFKLQTWGQDSLHPVLHCVFTPVSAAHRFG